jgi:hypothetical protein
VGTAPLSGSIAVDVGAHTIKVRTPDGATATQNMTVLAGQTQAARLALTKVVPAAKRVLRFGGASFAHFVHGQRTPQGAVSSTGTADRDPPCFTVRHDDSSRNVTETDAECTPASGAANARSNGTPATADDALRLAIKLAIDAEDYERASAELGSHALECDALVVEDRNDLELAAQGGHVASKSREQVVITPFELRELGLCHLRDFRNLGLSLSRLLAKLAQLHREHLTTNLSV